MQTIGVRIVDSDRKREHVLNTSSLSTPNDKSWYKGHLKASIMRFAAAECVRGMNFKNKGSIEHMRKDHAANT